MLIRLEEVKVGEKFKYAGINFVKVDNTLLKKEFYNKAAIHVDACRIQYFSTNPQVEVDRLTYADLKNGEWFAQRGTVMKKCQGVNEHGEAFFVKDDDKVERVEEPPPF